MTVKKRRQSVRKADEPGHKTQPIPPTPEQPILPDGSPLERPPTYEVLASYKTRAELKLKAYQELLVDVYKLLALEEPDVDRAKELLTNFDRRIPKIGDRQ